VPAAAARLRDGVVEICTHAVHISPRVAAWAIKVSYEAVS